MKNRPHQQWHLEDAIRIACFLVLSGCGLILITLHASPSATAQFGCSYPPLYPNPQEQSWPGDATVNVKIDALYDESERQAFVKAASGSGMIGKLTPVRELISVDLQAYSLWTTPHGHLITPSMYKKLRLRRDTMLRLTRYLKLTLPGRGNG